MLNRHIGFVNNVHPLSINITFNTYITKNHTYLHTPRHISICMSKCYIQTIFLFEEIMFVNK